MLCTIYPRTVFLADNFVDNRSYISQSLGFKMWNIGGKAMSKMSFHAIVGGAQMIMHTGIIVPIRSPSNVYGILAVLKKGVLSPLSGIYPQGEA